MSYRRAYEALHGRFTDRVPWMTFVDKPSYLRKLTGIDPYKDPRGAFIEAARLWDVDLLFGGPPDNAVLPTAAAGHA